jgi:hypothetical protein
MKVISPFLALFAVPLRGNADPSSYCRVALTLEDNRLIYGLCKD